MCALHTCSRSRCASSCSSRSNTCCRRAPTSSAVPAAVACMNTKRRGPVYTGLPAAYGRKGRTRSGVCACAVAPPVAAPAGPQPCPLLPACGSPLPVDPCAAAASCGPPVTTVPRPQTSPPAAYDGGDQRHSEVRRRGEQKRRVPAVPTPPSCATCLNNTTHLQGLQLGLHLSDCHLQQLALQVTCRSGRSVAQRLGTRRARRRQQRCRHLPPAGADGHGCSWRPCS